MSRFYKSRFGIIGGLIERHSCESGIPCWSKGTVERLSIDGFGTLSKATRDGRRSCSGSAARGPRDEQIAVVRAIFHVQPNKIRWGAYEQQDHLYDMATKLKMDIPRIARLLGVPEQKVQRLIEAYEGYDHTLCAN